MIYVAAGERYSMLGLNENENVLQNKAPESNAI